MTQRAASGTRGRLALWPGSWKKSPRSIPKPRTPKSGEPFNGKGAGMNEMTIFGVPDWAFTKDELAKVVRYSLLSSRDDDRRGARYAEIQGIVGVARERLRERQARAERFQYVTYVNEA